MAFDGRVKLSDDRAKALPCPPLAMSMTCCTVISIPQLVPWSIMFKTQTLIKSIIKIVYLKTLPQALDNTSLIKAKPLELCLPCC